MGRSEIKRAHTHTVLASLPPRPGDGKVEPIQKHINNMHSTSETDREDFLIAMVKPLVMYGATFNMIEDQLLETARHFSIKVTVVRKPGLFVCILGEYGGQRRKIKIADSRGRSAARKPNVLGLLGVTDTFKAVTQDEMGLGEGVQTLNSMPGERFALSRPVRHLAMAVVLAAGMCSVVGGTPNEAMYASQATLALCFVQLLFKKFADLLADFFEVTVAITISLISHDPHIRALSSTLLGILPGYIYICTAIRLSPSQNTTSPSLYLRTLLAIVYTLCLKSGLPIMLDVWLMFRLYMLVMLNRALFDMIMRRRTVLTIRAQGEKAGKTRSAPASFGGQ